jgi:hypothetical protein
MSAAEISVDKMSVYETVDEMAVDNIYADQMTD